MHSQFRQHHAYVSLDVVFDVVRYQSVRKKEKEAKRKKNKHKRIINKMLNNFGVGWIRTFEKHLDYVTKFLPDISVISVERHKAMLRIKFSAPTEDLQYVLDCVSYKIERESARTCEMCGGLGVRRFSEWLQEPLCLCTTCYALHVDAILSNQ